MTTLSSSSFSSPISWPSPYSLRCYFCTNRYPSRLLSTCNRNNNLNKKKRKKSSSNRSILFYRANAIEQLSQVVTSVPPEPPVDISWQILVGSLAGITPFIVAGIEFSKRIMAQRKCEVCQGSGLVIRAGVYIRCTSCGGFLPWQSWKRFFTG